MGTKTFSLETADADPGVAGKFSEGDVKALVAIQVAKETEALSGEVADLKGQVTTLKAERASLEDQLEIAKTAAAEAQVALETFKADLEKAEADKKIADARTAEVAKVAPALEATEERRARWAALDEAQFASLLEDYRATSGGDGGDGSVGSFAAGRRESAMRNVQSAVAHGSRSAAASVLGL